MKKLKQKTLKQFVFEQRKTKIANKIKNLRMRAGYKSSETFANDYGLPRVQYWRMEKGTNFTFKGFNRLLEIHNISPSEFFLDIH